MLRLCDLKWLLTCNDQREILLECIIIKSTLFPVISLGGVKSLFMNQCGSYQGYVRSFNPPRFIRKHDTWEQLVCGMVV